MDREEGDGISDRDVCTIFHSVLLCSAATAFLINSVPLPVPVDNLIPLFDPLKMLLKTLGISVEHLVQGLKKCVDELGPEASESVKKLLVMTTWMGRHSFHERSLSYMNVLSLLISTLFLFH